MYVLSVLDVCFVYFLKRYMQQNKECKHHIKCKNEFFFAKFGLVQMGHLHTCPLHLKLMPTASLSHISLNEETRNNTFDYIFYSQLKTMLLNLSDYLIRFFSQLFVTCHVHLCNVINHSLSLYHCREHK